MRGGPPGVLRRPRSPGVRHDRPPSRAADRPHHPHPPSAAGRCARPRPPPRSAAAPARSRIVDNAVYSEGRRVATPETAAESREELAEGEDRLAWLGLYRPEPQELGELAELYDLPELAVEDAIKAHQRPKFERYGNTLFVVLKAARYLDEAEEVEFGELHLFLGADFAITVRHSESPDLSRVRRRLESEPALLAKGSEAVLYATLDAVVDGYRRWSTGWPTTSTRSRPRSSAATPGCPGASTSCRRRCSSSSGPSLPLTGILAAITAGFDKYGVDEELRSYLRDVADHVTQVNERAEGFRLQLRDILTVNATLVAQRQNEEIRELTEASIAQGEEVKKISAWAAILFAPTLVGTVYGMNFDRCPRLDWQFGYPFALLLMAGVSVDAVPGVQAARLDLSACPAGTTSRASSGCPAAPGCAAGGWPTPVPPADFAARAGAGPGAGLAAPAGPLARLLDPARHRRRARRAAGGAPPGRWTASGWRWPARGGVGRTGTALAALAVLDGLPPEEAVRWVRGSTTTRGRSRRRGSGGGCAGSADRRTPSSGGTRRRPEPLGCAAQLHRG